MDHVVITAANTPAEKLLEAVAAALRCAPGKITLNGFSADMAAPVAQLATNAGTPVILL